MMIIHTGLMYAKTILVAGGTDKNIKIFDKRGSKIIKTFDGVHYGKNLDLFKQGLDV